VEPGRGWRGRHADRIIGPALSVVQTPRVQNTESTQRRLHVQPMRDLWREGWHVFAAMSLPLFGACYLLTAGSNVWPIVVTAHLVATGVFAAVAGRLHGAGVLIDDDGIHERAYLRSTVSTPLSAVRAVLLVPVHRTLVTEVTHQLFVVDRAGGTLLRMRGQLWHRRDLLAVAHRFGTPVQVTEAPMTWAELRRSPFRSNLEPWERHPVLTGTGIVVLAIAVIAPAVSAVTRLVAL